MVALAIVGGFAYTMVGVSFFWDLGDQILHEEPRTPLRAVGAWSLAALLGALWPVAWALAAIDEHRRYARWRR